MLPKAPFPAATGTFLAANKGEAFLGAGADFFTAIVAAGAAAAFLAAGLALGAAAAFLGAGAALGAGALAPVEAPLRAGAERGPLTTGAEAFLGGAMVTTCTKLCQLLGWVWGGVLEALTGVDLEGNKSGT